MIKRLKNTIAKSIPVRIIVNISKQLKIPGFEGIPLYYVASFFIQRIKEGELQKIGRAHV